MVKIGIIGAGHLGKIHIRLLKEIHNFNLIGFFDTNSINAQKIAAEFDIPAFSSVTELIARCDAIDVVTPTESHFEYAKLALESDKHLFIEKPITATIEEANKLLELSN